MRRCVLIALVLALSSCGGSVERDPGTGGAASSAGGASAGGSGGGWSSEPLDECNPGFSHYQNPTSPCPWLADGLCYAEKKDACACVCPKHADSVCVSDFPDPSGAPVAVTCS